MRSGADLLGSAVRRSPALPLGSRAEAAPLWRGAEGGVDAARSWPRVEWKVRERKGPRVTVRGGVAMSLGAEVRGDSEFCSGPIAKVRRFHSDPFGPLFFPDAARMAWASAVGFARPSWCLAMRASGPAAPERGGAQRR